MKFNKEIINGWNVFIIEGEMSFSNIEDLDVLSEEVKKTMKKGDYKFVFNLEKVPFIDSSGISIIILAVSKAMKNKTPIRICCLNEETKKSFELIKINFALEYYDSQEEAVKN